MKKALILLVFIVFLTLILPLAVVQLFSVKNEIKQYVPEEEKAPEIGINTYVEGDVAGEEAVSFLSKNLRT